MKKIKKTKKKFRDKKIYGRANNKKAKKHSRRPSNKSKKSKVRKIMAFLKNRKLLRKKIKVKKASKKKRK
ncbi:MAG: hypothetical protein AABW90_04285 [Nanoarchaeota archaeon]